MSYTSWRKPLSIQELFDASNRNSRICVAGAALVPESSWLTESMDDPSPALIPSSPTLDDAAVLLPRRLEDKFHLQIDQGLSNLGGAAQANSLQRWLPCNWKEVDL